MFIENKRGFTLIELLTVIAILGILVLLAAPKFLGYTEKANIAKIQTGIKAVETAVDLKSLENPEFTADLVTITPDKLQEINNSGKLIDKNGFIKEDLEGGKNIPLEDLDNVKWSSGGEFILSADGESVYYYNKDINVSKNPDGTVTTPGGNDGDNSPTEPEGPKYPIKLPNGDFEQEDGTITTIDGGVRQPDGSVNYPNGDVKDPDGMIIHTDGSITTTDGIKVPVASNFTWVSDSSGYTAIGQTGTGYYKYTGTGESTVVIPYVINGNPMTSYYRMFYMTGADVTKVISTNTKVTNMREMFQYSPATSLDLSLFDTSNVTDMNSMFRDTKATSLDLSSFNTSNVTNMSDMFKGSKATTLDLSSFDTSNVTNMRSMFWSSPATLLDLSSFDTSKVSDMTRMFYDSQATIINLSKFNTSNVTDMSWMFSSSEATILDLSSFNTSNVTNMSGMFYSSKATTLDLSSFNTSNVTDMSGMFSYSQKTTLDLRHFDTSNVINMASMFASSRATTLDLSSFNTSKVTNMSDMFKDSQATTLDLSSFNTSNVTDMNNMFQYTKATTGYARTQTDANRFNATANKPNKLTFRTK